MGGGSSRVRACVHACMSVYVCVKETEIQRKRYGLLYIAD